MSYVMPIAFGAGYLGAGALSYLAGGRSLRAVAGRVALRDPKRNLPGFLGVVGGGVAFVPALLVGTAIGGNLGAAYCGAATSALGLGYVGVPLGLACGIALVTTAVTCGGALLGAAIGMLLERLASNARSS